MKEGKRFNFKPVPSRLSFLHEDSRSGQRCLSIPIEDNYWRTKTFLTQVSHSGIFTHWYFITLHPDYQEVGKNGKPSNAPFVFKKQYAEIDLERKTGVVGKPLSQYATGGSYNLRLKRMDWFSNSDIFIIDDETPLMNWDSVPWSDKK